MSRAARLLDLLQVLRRHRQPIDGAALAQSLGVSPRTLYRDIATLQAQGAQITGEPGVGYVLKPDFMLPPLMFTLDELEALSLGSRWVAERGDARLGEAARHALAKISAVLPAELRHELESQALLVGPRDIKPARLTAAQSESQAEGQVLPEQGLAHQQPFGLSLAKPAPALPSTSSGRSEIQAQGERGGIEQYEVLPQPQTQPSENSMLESLRLAIRQEHKVELHYLDLKGRPSLRTVWPFALGFFDQVHMLVAWCELRQDLRSFRIDRIQGLDVSTTRYPRRRQALLKEWRAREGIKPEA